MTDLGSHVGQVKWFDPKKGFGFIVGPEGQDVFVHYSQIGGIDGFKALKDGESVSYALLEGDKGFQAREVERLEVNVTADTPPAPKSASIAPAKPPKADAF